MENRGARRESVADTRPYNEILIPPFDFDFLEKRSMEIKLLQQRYAVTINQPRIYNDDSSNKLRRLYYVQGSVSIVHLWGSFSKGNTLRNTEVLRDLYANRLCEIRVKQITRIFGVYLDCSLWKIFRRNLYNSNKIFLKFMLILLSINHYTHV